MQAEITKEVAEKVLTTVDAGLVKGVGKRVPGQMCVEAAVCYALGLPHGDDPGCVAPTLRSLKIRLNDASWSSNEARAKGLRRLALAQLGSKDVLDEKEFARRIADYALRVSTPKALRSAASVIRDEKHKAALCEAANRCEKEASREAALEARAIARAVDAYAAAAAAAAADADADDDAYADAAYAAYAAYAAAAAAAAAADAYAYADAYADAKSARDRSLAEYAEAVVQILIEMKAPGCQWLVLTEKVAA
jgi:hypothetical protein